MLLTLPVIRRCMSSMSKYGPPVKCEICQQTCAFNRSDLRIDGKLHCWLCKLSYKRALAKAKKSDIDKHRDRAKKRPNDESHKSSGSSLKIGGGNRNSNNLGSSRELGKSSDLPDKISKTSNSVIAPSHNTDHVVALTQLREQIATLQKKLQQKDNQLLQKDKEVSEFFELLLWPFLLVDVKWLNNFVHRKVFKKTLNIDSFPHFSLFNFSSRWIRPKNILCVDHWVERQTF